MTQFSLNTVLAEFEHENKSLKFTIGDSVEGIQIFGGVGSGKTSGSGAFLAKRFLSRGYGGLVLTAKSDEKDRWIDYCKETGRTEDLIIVEPDGKYTFDFLKYESTRKLEKGLTENLVQVLKTVIKASEGGTQGIGNDRFWDEALDLLLFNVIDLCLIAYEEVALQTMYDIVQSLPKSAAATMSNRETAYLKAMKRAAEKVSKLVQEWAIKDGSLPPEGDEYQKAIHEAIPQKRTWDMIEVFFKENYLTLSEKTRSIIDFSFSSFIFKLLREPVYSLFCKGGYNFEPEDCRKGAIILLNLPVKTHYKVGRDCQILFKYIWQRQMERTQGDNYTRPVFLWADEAQNFIHEHDAVYQATARSCKIATVYLTQNIPNYYAMMNGDKSEDRVKSFLGTLATKIFHANADLETNTYASDLIGEKFRDEYSINIGLNADGSPSNSQSISAHLQSIIRPELFVGLRTGGDANGRIIEAFMHRQGLTFGKHNYLKASFQQPKQ